MTEGIEGIGGIRTDRVNPVEKVREIMEEEAAEKLFQGQAIPAWKGK